MSITLEDTRSRTRLSPSELTAEVRRRAHELGFEKVGVVRAEALTEERARLEEWLARGLHASMGWMERGVERRTDPRELLPGARTVVAVALNYYTPHEHASGEGTGKISRYAWGDDYHDVLGEKLKALLARVRELAPEVRGQGLRGRAAGDGQGLGRARRAGVDRQAHEPHHARLRLVGLPRRAAARRRA